MSADNGVYILKTGNQYRVKLLHAIENLYYDYQGHYHSGKMQSEQIINMFGDCKYTYDINTAIKIAMIIENEIHSEYGIVLLDAKKSWGKIIKEKKDGTGRMG